MKHTVSFIEKNHIIFVQQRQAFSLTTSFYTKYAQSYWYWYENVHSRCTPLAFNSRPIFKPSLIETEIWRGKELSLNWTRVDQWKFSKKKRLMNKMLLWIADCEWFRIKDFFGCTIRIHLWSWYHQLQTKLYVLFKWVKRSKKALI